MTDDERIIALFFARSEDAIRELDEKYGAVCRGLSRRIVGSIQDAEECVNDAYLGAWNAIPPAKPEPLRAYICKIVRNLSLKRYHQQRTAKRGGGYTVAMEELEECLAGPADVEGELDVAELARVVQDFLDTLSEENQVIFLRRYWFADSGRDIAQRVGLTEKNVRVRLARIRQKLREYLLQREVLV